MSRTYRLCAPLAALLLAAPAAAQPATPATSAASAPSDADRATARQLGRQGVAALKARDYAKALDLFTRGERLYKAPTLSLGRARALAGAGRLVSALEAYRDVVREGPGPKPTDAFRKAVADAAAEAAKLEPRVGNVLIAVEGPPAARVTLDGEPLPDASVGVKRPIDPGAHVARARADGYAPAEVSFRVAEGASEVVTVRLERDGPAPAAGPLTPTTPDARTARAPEAPPPAAAAAVTASGGSSVRRTLGFTALGVGGASLVVGGVTGLMAVGKHATLDDECASGRCPPGQRDTLDSYRTLGTISTVGFVAGAALAGAGAYLLITAPKRAEGASARLWWGPAGGGLAGTF